MFQSVGRNSCALCSARPKPRALCPAAVRVPLGGLERLCRSCLHQRTGNRGAGSHAHAYEPSIDSFLCPAGQQLCVYSSSVLRGLKRIKYANRIARRDCRLRTKCTRNSLRLVSRLENEAVLDRMEARIARQPEMFARRRGTVEHPFGSLSNG